MNDEIPRIRETLEDSDFLQRSFPVLFHPGVKDEDVLIHSIGCSLWNTLGHELGFSAVVEAPAPAAAGCDIRSDSVWFSRRAWSPEVLIEFERFEGGVRGTAKLDAKFANLLEAAARWGRGPRLLILSAWSKGIVNAPSVDGFRHALLRGINNSLGVQVPGRPECALLFARFIFRTQSSGLLSLHSSSFAEVV